MSNSTLTKKKEKHHFCRKCNSQAGVLMMLTKNIMSFECDKCLEMWVVKFDMRRHKSNHLAVQEGFVILKRTTKKLPEGFLHGPGSQSPIMKGYVHASGIEQIKVGQLVAFKRAGNTELMHKGERLWVIPHARVVSHGDV